MGEKNTPGCSSTVSTGHFTRTELKIVRYLRRWAGKPRSKVQIATALDCNVKTVDRLVSLLRKKGIVEVEFRFAENGSQLPSTYKVSTSCEVAAAIKDASEYWRRRPVISQR